MWGHWPTCRLEQLENAEKSDSRSDIYSLGATLFFLLTGRTPYTGEFIDIVYGHRHGAIPDLMKIRDDVDLSFANIFQRMMAKSPEQRYASLDEVIDELTEYADKSTTPQWLAEFSQQSTDDHGSTMTGGSTSTSHSEVLGIDLGMFYAAAAKSTPEGETGILAAGAMDQPLLRLAVASDGKNYKYGRDAMELRPDFPEKVVHCLPLYIGKDVVDRQICDRPNPPEVLIAMLLKQIQKNAWRSDSAPSAVAITVPASYDQLHRRAIMQAGKMAGINSIRLIDRSVAATQSLLIHGDEEIESDDSIVVEEAIEQTILFVGLSGNSSEIALLKRDGSRLQQLSTSGHWHCGTLRWLHTLVELAAETFLKTFKLDLRKSLKSAAQLQISCERAMNSMLLLPHVNISINHNGKIISVPVHRAKWLERCGGMVDDLRQQIKVACERASVEISSIDSCVVFGPMLQNAEVKEKLLVDLPDDIKIQAVDRSDTARGAASCIAGELPGREKAAHPPSICTSQSIGIVIEDARGRRRILPIIPRGTALPARTNRKLSVGANRETMTLSLVESSGVAGDDWQSLGRYVFDIPKDDSVAKKRTRMISFQIDRSGLLTVRTQTPGATGSKRLANLPKPNLDSDAANEWETWLNTVR